MPNPRVNLFETSESGISDIMNGPWKNIQVLTMEPGESRHLDGTVDEHCLFTISGSAEVTEPDGRRWSFAPGSTLTLPQGGVADLRAGSHGFRYLIITMRVDH